MRPALRALCAALVLALAPAAWSETTPVNQPASSRLVFLGDSLTAGYQLNRASAYPALIQARLKAAGLPWEVLNAGVSGDTSAGALRRAEAILKDPPALLVVWIGANDGLRGQDPVQMSQNLDRILAAAKAAKVRTLLVQMEIPPNYGEDYTRRFREVYPALAAKHGVPLLPFGLAGVAGEEDLNLPDGVHPNVRGHERIAETLWTALEPHLRK